MPGNDIGYKMYVYGKIVVGAVMLVIQAVGIKVSVDKSTMEGRLQELRKQLRGLQRSRRPYGSLRMLGQKLETLE